MKVLLLMSVIMTSIVALQVKIQDLLPVMQPEHELLLPAPFSSENEANSTTQTQIFLQEQAEAGAGAVSYLPATSYSLSKAHPNYAAKNCFDRNFNSFCHGLDAKQSLTAKVTGKVEKIRITNRKDPCCQERWKNSVLIFDGKQIGKITKEVTTFNLEIPNSLSHFGEHTFTLKAFGSQTLNIAEVEFYGLAAYCAGGSAAIAEFGNGDVVVCSGAVTDGTGDVSTSPACSAGYHVCTGQNVVDLKVTYAWGTSFPNCYAYDATQDCDGCSATCATNTNVSPVKLCPDKPSGRDRAGFGKDCSVNIKGKKGCTTGGRIDAGQGCSTSTKVAGVACCKNADEDAHDSISNILTDIKKSIQNELESATATATKECTSDTKAPVMVHDMTVQHPDPNQKRDFKYKDLIGCAAGSECETSTEAQQKIAVAAHKKLWVRTAIGEELARQLESLRRQEAAKEAEKDRLEREIADNGKLHKARMAKFTHAITSLTKINEHLINTGEIKMPTLLEEEKNVIGNFKLGKVMLLMLDQASTGVKEKELVNTLKKLLSSCINSLEDSKKVEKEKHDNWVNMKHSQIKSCEAAIQVIIGDKAETAAKITANDQVIANEERKKRNALATHKTERDSCLALHNNFVDAAKNHKSEIDAIDNMVKIVNDAKLNAQTQAIRDETEKTKHGVKESVEQEL